MDIFEIATELYKAARKGEWQHDTSRDASINPYYRIIPVPSNVCESKEELKMAVGLLATAANYANAGFNLGFKSTEVEGRLALRIEAASKETGAIFDHDQVQPLRSHQKPTEPAPESIEGRKYVPMSQAFSLIRQKDSRQWKMNGDILRQNGDEKMQFTPDSLLCREVAVSHGHASTFHLLEMVREEMNQLLSARGYPTNIVKDLTAEGKKDHHIGLAREHAHEVLVDILGLDPVALGFPERTKRGHT